MSHALALSAEADRYAVLALELKEAYADIDQETLEDTLEGMSDLPDLLKEVVRSSLDDEVLVEALQERVAAMKERLERLQTRHGHKRALVTTIMTKAGLSKILAEDFSVSLRQGPARLEITDERAISPAFLVMQAPKIDRAGLLAALKHGETVAGATLQTGLSYVQVRTK
jgi:hypothetical protein